MDYKDFLCVMAMLRVFATLGLARRAHIEPMWLVYVHYLIWVLCYASPNKAKILLFITSGRSSINKGGFTRYYFCVP
jgi:hypothetical protein